MSRYTSSSGPYEPSSDQPPTRPYTIYNAPQITSAQAPGSVPQSNSAAVQHNAALPIGDLQALGVNANQLAALFAQIQGAHWPPSYLTQTPPSSGYPPLPPPPPPLPPTANALLQLQQLAQSLQGSSGRPAPRETRSFRNDDYSHIQATKPSHDGWNSSDIRGPQPVTTLPHGTTDPSLQPRRAEHIQSVPGLQLSHGQSSHHMDASEPRYQKYTGRSREQDAGSKSAPSRGTQSTQNTGRAMNSTTRGQSGGSSHEHQPSTDNKKAMAERFVSLLDKQSYKYEDLIREGLDPVLLKEMYGNLGLVVADGPSHNPQSRPSDLGSSNGIKNSASAIEVVAPSAQHSLNLTSSSASETTKDHPIATVQKPVSTTVSSREAYLEKLKAAASVKQGNATSREQSAKPTLAAPLPSAGSKLPTIATPSSGQSASSTPKLASSSLAAEAQAKKRAQTELARKRMEALNAKRAAAAAAATAAAANRQTATLPSSSSSAVATPSSYPDQETSGHTAINDGQASHETMAQERHTAKNTQHSETSKPNIVEPSKDSMTLAPSTYAQYQAALPASAGQIPGLFIAKEHDTTPSLPPSRLRTPPPVTSSSKRALASPPSEDTDRPLSSLKRPFVPHDASGREDQCIIEVSDDEAGSTVGIDERLNGTTRKDDRPPKHPAAYLSKPGYTRQPSSNASSLPPSAYGSMVGTPVIQAPGSTHGTDELKRKEAEIALMKRRIQEKEAKQKRNVHLGSSVVATPNSSRATSELVATPRDVPPQQAAAHAILPSVSKGISPFSPPKTLATEKVSVQEQSLMPGLEGAGDTLQQPSGSAHHAASVGAALVPGKKLSREERRRQLLEELARLDREEDEGSEARSQTTPSNDVSASASDAAPTANDMDAPESSPESAESYSPDQSNDGIQSEQAGAAAGTESNVETQFHTAMHPIDGVDTLPPPLDSCDSASSGIRIPGLSFIPTVVSPSIPAPLGSGKISETGEYRSLQARASEKPEPHVTHEQSADSEDDAMDFSDGSEMSEDDVTSGLVFPPPTVLIPLTDNAQQIRSNGGQHSFSPCSSIFSRSTPEGTADRAASQDAATSQPATEGTVGVPAADNSARYVEAPPEEAEDVSGDDFSDSGSQSITDDSSDDEDVEMGYPGAGLANSATALESQPREFPFEDEARPGPITTLDPSPAVTTSNGSASDATSHGSGNHVVADSNIDHTAAHDASSSSPLAPNSSRKDTFKPYESALGMFKAYRFHPDYALSVPGGYRSLTYSHQIDANKPLCQYEAAGGICNDSECSDQHFRSMSLTDDMIMVQIGTSNPGVTAEEKQRWNDGLRAVLKNLRELDIRDPDVVASAITKFRREFLQDPSRVLNL